MGLTTCILVRDENPKETIESVSSLGGKILIGKIGESSVDGVKLRFENDYSKVKNSLISLADDWILFLEPWEKIIKGHGHILKAMEKIGAYHVRVLQGDILSKELKLWHKSKNLFFENPVFESVIDNTAGVIETIVSSKPIKHNNKQKIITEWSKKEPLSSIPNYYQSCLYLSEKKYDEFIGSANKFLFLNNKGLPVVMTKYYLAMVQLYIKKDTSSAIKNILPCIAVNPTMAEFWCLLGDIFYSRKQYNKAYDFYENAIILGERRPKDDLWPVEIQKYKTYPKNMMSQCLKILRPNQETT